MARSAEDIKQSAVVVYLTRENKRLFRVFCAMRGHSMSRQLQKYVESVVRSMDAPARKKLEKDIDTTVSAR